MTGAESSDVLVADVLLLDAGGARSGWLLTRDGRIEATGIGPAPDAPPGTAVVSGVGGVLVPGFTDLHVHGGGGASFDDADAAALEAIAATHRGGGTARFLASLVSAPLPRLEATLTRLREFAPAIPGFLGVHLEGPFLAPSRAGAHDPAALTAPTPDAVDRLLEAGGGLVRSMTVAPELPGGLGAVARLADAGVVVAVGHTEADYRTAREAFDAGARLVTHTFNAMPGLEHRKPGPIAAALEDERVVLELILDGVHVHPALSRLLFASAPGRVALVTDAVAATGRPDGQFLLGGLDVTVSDGRATLTGTDTLAGSTLTTAAALANAVAAGIEPGEAVAALTTVPGRVLGGVLDGGSDIAQLAPGAPADLVLLDEGYRVQRVWSGVSGR